MKALSVTSMSRTCIVFLIVSLLLPLSLHAQNLRTPDDFIGHPVGADYKLARWQTIVDYFVYAGENSDRVNTREIGKTTEGRPFIIAEVSSPDAIRDRQSHIEHQRKIADPRLIQGDGEEKRLIAESKVVVWINCNIHSTEIASSQMAMELLYARYGNLAGDHGHSRSYHHHYRPLRQS